MSKKQNLPLLIIQIFLISFFSINSYIYFSESNRDNTALKSLFEFIENKMSDAKFYIRGQLESSNSVALIAIDDESVEKLKKWPWPRDLIADLIEKTLTYEPKALGIDMIFPDPSAEIDDRIIKQIYKAGLPIESTVKLINNIKSHSPDHALSDAILKGKDKIILGNYSTDLTRTEAISESLQFCKLITFMSSHTNNIFNKGFAVDFSDTQSNKILSELILKIENIADAEAKTNTEIIGDCSEWKNSLAPAHREIQSYFNKNNLNDSFIKINANIKNVLITTNIKLNFNLFESAANEAALFNAYYSIDGVARQGPLFYRLSNRVIPSLGFATFLKGTNTKVNSIVPAQNNYQKSTIELLSEDNKTRDHVSMNDAFLMNINYLGKTHSIPHISANDILAQNEHAKIKFFNSQGQLEERNIQLRDFIKDRFLILGATATAIYDIRNNPYGQIPGPEIHGTIIDNLIQKTWLKPIPFHKLIIPLTTLIIGLIFSYFLLTQRFSISFASTLIILASVFFVDQILFKHNYILHTSFLTLELLLLFVASISYRFFIEERRRGELRKIFSQYVSPQIVEELIKSPETINLGGQKKNLTIFFSDVRGFTSIAESMDSEALVNYLNEYLTPMTEIIFNNKGTLDKYMGDGLLAFFGAPLHLEKGPICACKAAIESIRRLQDLNMKFISAGKPPIKIGIGVNTQVVSVGSMGSEILKNYTVIGDGVNLTARLESATKYYQVPIIISEATYLEVKDSFHCRKLDVIKVKGKEQPIVIYELVEFIEQAVPTWLKQFEQGLNYYFEQNWGLAQFYFDNCLKINSMDGPTKIYLQRIETLKNTPLPKNWDGVFEMKEK